MALSPTIFNFNSRPHGGRPTSMWMMLFPGSFNFNSRPHGGRHKSRRVYALYYAFQLTPSRRATENALFDTASIHISTHALTEGDWPGWFLASCTSISTHALTEGDGVRFEWNIVARNFNSRPHGGRRGYTSGIPGDRDFNSRPHGGRPCC